MNSKLELAAAILNFAGGAILTLEALRIKSRIQAESGARRLLDALNRIGAPEVLKDAKGNPISNERALQLWLADHSLRWAWVGFLLMSAGFLLEIAASL